MKFTDYLRQLTKDWLEFARANKIWWIVPLLLVLLLLSAMVYIIQTAKPVIYTVL